MSETARWAKAHSQWVADEYQRLGWRLASEFCIDGKPYEWLLEWCQPTAVVVPDSVEPHDRPHPAGAIPTTDLEYWASLGRLGEVAEALTANPDANIRGIGGSTAMHAAAENGHVDVIRLLAGHGAQISPRLDTGETPLALAEMARQLAVVSLLRSLGP